MVYIKNVDKFTIGKLARLAGVNIQTVRYYERAGLLHPISKTGAGYRLYGEGELKRLRFVRHAKELGFTLKEIKELMELRVDSPSACAEVLKRAEEKLRDVEEKIEKLNELRGILNELTTACRERTPTGECPILKSIEKGGESHDT